MDAVTHTVEDIEQSDKWEDVTGPLSDTKILNPAMLALGGEKTRPDLPRHHSE